MSKYICENRDCKFYSTFTDTCDFTLMNFRSRPCPIDGCTEYVQRTERRSWMEFWPFANKFRTEPEPPPEPAEPRSVVADCGCDVYAGELLYLKPDGSTLCPDCAEDEFDRLTAARKAELLGMTASPVGALR
ncbi:MAG: hypothetical protein LBS90_06320 [Oscillospiraceae bacterium]|jgi:hypothetical protein|nr:hypothetical protein [Oscillospiraceae bacterium]